MKRKKKICWASVWTTATEIFSQTELFLFSTCSCTYVNPISTSPSSHPPSLTLHLSSTGVKKNNSQSTAKRAQHWNGVRFFFLPRLCSKATLLKHPEACINMEIALRRGGSMHKKERRKCNLTWCGCTVSGWCNPAIPREKPLTWKPKAAPSDNASFREHGVC